MDTSNSFYLGLDQSLHTLRVHFDMSRGATNDEVLEWAKYFLDWSHKAMRYCGPWSAENLNHAESFVRNLEKSSAGIVGYEVLERTMGEAALNLNQEILDVLKQPCLEKQLLPAK
jgi:hypothetical protein